jgi:branched-chain amino acid aminotransferase
MSRVASIDGVIHPPEEAKVSVYDRGFLYGDSVFETVRTYAGEPFALDRHLERLERSCASVFIPLPLPRADLAMEVRLAIRAAKNPESSARIMITRGSGPVGLDPALAAAPLRAILVEPLLTPPKELYQNGSRVITVRTERASDAAHGAKVGNYLGSLLALRRAKAAGAHEALILDHAGRVVEGTTSNVFLVRGGELVTPPDDAALLQGITRMYLFEIAKELRIQVTFEFVTPEDLVKADEVFVSSSIREILPVVEVDGERVADGKPGPVTRRLHAAFRAKVGVGADPMPWE